MHGPIPQLGRMLWQLLFTVRTPEALKLSLQSSPRTAKIPFLRHRLPALIASRLVIALHLKGATEALVLRAAHGPTQEG